MGRNLLFKKLKAIRGAVCCKDNSEEISQSVKKLYCSILQENNLSEKDIVSIQFTLTQDITNKNPAGALRQNGFAKSIPLLCSIEPNIINSFPNTIRILIHCYSRKKIKHVYLGNAKKLRPDLSR